MRIWLLATPASASISDRAPRSPTPRTCPGATPKPGNQTRVYNLYTDLNDRETDLSARLGRQTLRNQGVLGRFDGALVSWQWAPDYRLNLLAGFPVYSSDESIETSRNFYGFSVDVLNLLDRI